MKVFLKILKWVGIVVLLLILIAFIAVKVASEKLPEGNPSAEADQLAKDMMAAVDVAGWDSTSYVSWNFAGRQQLLWDKERNLVRVQFEGYTAYVVNDEISGEIYQNDQLLEGNDADKLIKTAWRHAQNAAFWLNAPVKAFDPGTTRSLVTLKDGRKGLKVSYSSGGVTPGDSYVWILDENNRPLAWKMWVKIIPVKGIETSWQDYTTLSTGAQLSQKHLPTFMERGLDLTDIKGGETWESVGEQTDPFTVLFD